MHGLSIGPCPFQRLHDMPESTLDIDKSPGCPSVDPVGLSHKHATNSDWSHILCNLCGIPDKCISRDPHNERAVTDEFTQLHKFQVAL